MEQPDEKPPKPENEAFSDNSLNCIAKECGGIHIMMQLAMYLNIPNTTIVKCKIEKEDKGQSDKDLGAALFKCWKEMKCGKEVKEKNKAHEIERALQSIGRQDMADAFMECYRNHQELTPAAMQ
ncbi:uncharacterized protein LOC135490701 [Lineus longissimus]|uniref:uncharacterized protein LOC135490701 n=1 Tax=Lineus longissimus TaxID=88925 RepID=UPI002B4CBC49